MVKIRVYIPKLEVFRKKLVDDSLVINDLLTRVNGVLFNLPLD